MEFECFNCTERREAVQTLELTRTFHEYLFVCACVRVSWVFVAQSVQLDDSLISRLFQACVCITNAKGASSGVSQVTGRLAAGMALDGEKMGSSLPPAENRKPCSAMAQRDLLHFVVRRNEQLRTNTGAEVAHGYNLYPFKLYPPLNKSFKHM